MLFVDVLLPLHLPGTYTYRLPVEYEESVRVGQRVMVQFGAKRLYSALVRRIHDQVPAYRTKYVLAILDLEPIVTERQFRFWEWMASYYMMLPSWNTTSSRIWNTQTVPSSFAVQDVASIGSTSPVSGL